MPIRQNQNYVCLPEESALTETVCCKAFLSVHAHPCYRENDVGLYSVSGSCKKDLIVESDEVKTCNRQSLASIIVEYLRLVTRNSNT